jgi:hypothetical protein
MGFEPNTPVVTKDDERQLWNVKFFDRDGKPRSVLCVNEEEAEKISRLVRNAGDLIASPLQIMRLEVSTGQKEFATPGHVDKSLFVALVNYEFETKFHPDDAQHTYLREPEGQKSGRIVFEHCQQNDARAFAATVVSPG